MSFYIITLSDCQREKNIYIFFLFYLVYSDITLHCSGTNENDAYQNTFGTKRTRTECKMSTWLHPGLDSLIFIVLRVSQPVAFSCCDTYKYLTAFAGHRWGNGFHAISCDDNNHSKIRGGGAATCHQRNITDPFLQIHQGGGCKKGQGSLSPQPTHPPPSPPIPQFGIPLWRFLPPGA